MEGHLIVNKVIKQGNSLCVRIPSHVTKQADLKVGDEVSLLLTPVKNYEYDEESAETFLKITKKIKKLRKFTEDKLRMFIIIHFRYLKEVYQKSMSQQKVYFNKLRKEYSSKFVDDYLYWAQTINKEAFIHSKDGTLVMKPEYAN